MREPYAVKIARTVPGRGEGGNTLSLFDETKRRGSAPIPQLAQGVFPLCPFNPAEIKILPSHRPPRLSLPASLQ